MRGPPSALAEISICFIIYIRSEWGDVDPAMVKALEQISSELYTRPAPPPAFIFLVFCFGLVFSLHDLSVHQRLLNLYVVPPLSQHLPCLSVALIFSRCSHDPVAQFPWLPRLFSIIFGNYVILRFLTFLFGARVF